MQRGVTGHWMTSRTGGEPVRAFVPHPLPPQPPLDLTPDLQDRLDQALLALGRLDLLEGLLPDPDLLVYSYVRKEAVLSSRIEGTQSSLSDLLLFELDEAPGVPLDDVREVSSYLAAMQHGLGRLRDDGFPLCTRLLCEMHALLLQHGRGADKQPGELRRSQNWIGGTRPGNAHYVPPPPDAVPDAMGALERFLHDQPVRTPVIVKAALAHVQFETIHPFLDGNGRIGRMLITLLLCAEGVLREPLLYLSLWLEQHRGTYYDLLQKVRLEGDWEAWLAFFADGIRETATRAVATARSLRDLFEADRQRITALARSPVSLMRVHEELRRHPILSIAELARRSQLTVPTITSAVATLASPEVGIVREITGKRRNRLFSYAAYLALLSEGD